MKKVLHVINNAHIDPVWLWDWREGLNEGIATCDAILKLMDEFPELTFTRGECAVYEHILRYAPELFRRIRERVEEGRWEIVGGNYVQSDTNLPSGATFLRQYERGRKWFREHFGKETEIAWAADSFGHHAGLPEIYAAAGFRYFAFCRPAHVPIAKPLFYWRGQGGSRILSWRVPFGGYCTERDQIPWIMNQYLEGDDFGLRNHPVFVGMGDHGGGTSRAMVLDILRWREEHAGEIEVKFSTLEDFFKASEADIADKGGDFLPVFSGELNFCLRGCFTSAARIKWRFRKAEAELARAERLQSLAARVDAAPAFPLDKAWDGLLFNTFHDILPGSCIRRAALEQCEWLDGVIHDARSAVFDAMDRIANHVEIRVPEAPADGPRAVPVMIFNPRNVPVETFVEVEACMDYRPSFRYLDNPDDLPFELLDENDRPVPFQRIDAELEAMPRFPWRRRMLTPVTLPAGGWRVLKTGMVKTPRLTEFTGVPVTASEHAVANGFYHVEACPGDFAIRVTRPDGTPVFAREGLGFSLWEDLYGAWGGMTEEEESWMCPNRIESWRISEVKLLESGPIRAALWVKFLGSSSCAEVVISLSSGRDAADLKTRLMWNDRSARLRLAFDPAGEVVSEVGCGTVRRRVIGDVPTGRWQLVRHDGGRTTAIAVDNLTGAISMKQGYMLNIIRGCRATSDTRTNSAYLPERPALDAGEYEFRMILADGADAARAAELADEIQFGPETLCQYPHDGELPMQCGGIEVSPREVRVIRLSPGTEGKVRIVLQSPRKTTARIRLGNATAEAVCPAWKLVETEF